MDVLNNAKKDGQKVRSPENIGNEIFGSLNFDVEVAPLETTVDGAYCR